VTYTAKTNFGLCVSAPTIGELLQTLADVTKAKPTLNDPLHVMEGVDEVVECLAQASPEQMRNLHAAHPLTATEKGVTPLVMQDSFNSKEGTALLQLLGAPASVRNAAMEARGMTITVEPGTLAGERQVVTVTRRSTVGEENWSYAFVSVPIAVQFEDGIVQLRAEVISTRCWFKDQGLCAECEGICRGGHGKPERDNIVERLPPKARVVGSPTPLAQLMADYRAAAVESFKRLSPNPHAGVKAEAIAPLLAYLAGMIRFLVKNGIDCLPDSDLACPWYVVGCSLANQYGLTESSQIASFGLTAIDEWDGFATVMEPEGAHMLRSTPPPGNN